MVAIGIDDQGIQHGLHVPLDLRLYHLNVTGPQVFWMLAFGANDTPASRRRLRGVCVELIKTPCPDALPFPPSTDLQLDRVIRPPI